MIKRIYQLADIHIPTYQKLDMYEKQLANVIKSIEQDVQENNLQAEEIRIVICGDLVHSKNIITNELNVFASTFIRQLSQIGTVICIAGNHDMIDKSSNRTDTLTAIFQTAQFDNAYFLDMELGYASGISYDENITWALYSYFDEFNCPQLDLAKAEYPDNCIVGLFHGSIIGSKLFNGFSSDVGCDGAIFNGCDCVLAGHIHKPQEIKNNGVPIVYSGSLIQQNFGESVSKHGYYVWDIEQHTHHFVEMDSDFGYYTFKITSLEDLKEDNEILVNC